jgi:predicted nucleic-acid-binding protein
MMIKVSNSITIFKDSETVFNFVADLQNDKAWRQEINATIMSGKTQIDVIATEDSFLSKKVPNYISKLLCTEYIAGKKIIYETLPENIFFLKSVRTIISVNANETTFNYTIEFDKSIVKHGLGFNLPTFLVTFVANTDMKKYLAKLKSILEKNN